jgi:hypothetical protein
MPLCPGSSTTILPVKGASIEVEVVARATVVVVAGLVVEVVEDTAVVVVAGPDVVVSSPLLSPTQELASKASVEARSRVFILGARLSASGSNHWADHPQMALSERRPLSMRPRKVTPRS